MHRRKTGGGTVRRALPANGNAVVTVSKAADKAGTLKSDSHTDIFAYIPRRIHVAARPQAERRRPRNANEWIANTPAPARSPDICDTFSHFSIPFVLLRSAE